MSLSVVLQQVDRRRRHLERTGAHISLDGHVNAHRDRLSADAAAAAWRHTKCPGSAASGHVVPGGGHCRPIRSCLHVGLRRGCWVAMAEGRLVVWFPVRAYAESSAGCSHSRRQFLRRLFRGRNEFSENDNFSGTKDSWHDDRKSEVTLGKFIMRKIVVYIAASADGYIASGALRSSG